MKQPKISESKSALYIAYSLFIMFLMAMYAELFVRLKLIIPGDPEQTQRLLTENQFVFYSGIAAYIIVLTTDIIAAIFIYHLLKNSGRRLALFSSLSRLVYVIFFGAAIFQLVSGNNTVAREPVESMIRFESYEKIWALGLILFGCHLMLTARLLCRKEIIPKWLIITLFIAGATYVTDNLLKLTDGNYTAYKAVSNGIVALFSITGELGFAISLLVFSKKSRKSETGIKESLSDPA